MHLPLVAVEWNAPVSIQSDAGHLKKYAAISPPEMLRDDNRRMFFNLSKLYCIYKIQGLQYYLPQNKAGTLPPPFPPPSHV